MDAAERIDSAAKSIREAANEQLKRGLSQAAAWVLDNNDATKRVVDDWIADSNNIEAIPFHIDPSSLEPTKRRFMPIVFSHRITKQLRLKREGKCIVLIALEDLSAGNGLMAWKDGPKTLQKGQSTYFRGEEELTLGEDGGGLAIWLEIRISDDS